MIYFFYTTVCLALTIAQTAILPRLPAAGGCYDLLIPFIVYLSPFGLYLTVYFWLFIAVKGVTGLVQTPDRLLIAAVVVAAGVLAENFIFMGALALAAPGRQLGTQTIGGIAIQGVVAFFTGPLLILFFQNAYQWMVDFFKTRKREQE